MANALTLMFGDLENKCMRQHVTRAEVDGKVGMFCIDVYCLKLKNKCNN